MIVNYNNNYCKFINQNQQFPDFIELTLNNGHCKSHNNHQYQAELAEGKGAQIY